MDLLFSRRSAEGTCWKLSKNISEYLLDPLSEHLLNFCFRTPIISWSGAWCLLLFLWCVIKMAEVLYLWNTKEIAVLLLYFLLAYIWYSRKNTRQLSRETIVGSWIRPLLDHCSILGSASSVDSDGKSSVIVSTREHSRRVIV